MKEHVLSQVSRGSIRLDVAHLLLPALSRAAGHIRAGCSAQSRCILKIGRRSWASSAVPLHEEISYFQRGRPYCSLCPLSRVLSFCTSKEGLALSSLYPCFYLAPGYSTYQFICQYKSWHFIFGVLFSNDFGALVISRLKSTFSSNLTEVDSSSKKN